MLHSAANASHVEASCKFQRADSGAKGGPHLRSAVRNASPKATGRQHSITILPRNLLYADP